MREELAGGCAQSLQAAGPGLIKWIFRPGYGIRFIFAKSIVTEQFVG
jgi:hypothetical protein